MAITITNADIAVAIRAATDELSIPAPISKVLAFLVPAASAMILQHAPEAPTAVHNAAMIRLCGWLYDADPTDSRISQALRVSGAAPLLAQWRVHRAGVITGVDDVPGVVPVPPATPAEPAPPVAGTYILVARDGELEWVRFQLPPGAVPVDTPGAGTYARIALEGDEKWFELPLS